VKPRGLAFLPTILCLGDLRLVISILKRAVP
jgi:hypothetical protein